MHSCSYPTGMWHLACIDTTKSFTLTTKLYTENNTDSGTLIKIVQVYTKNGKSVPATTLTKSTCSSGKYWSISGGFPALSKGLDLGQFTIFSFRGSGWASTPWLDGVQRDHVIEAVTV
ncbi:hypothetical protein BJ742DRAFT_775517 [Cladochytrium replicatum]|nr:hypothetical protein BJ742DRAFT_775517 [Cladochytrium replicatum]